LLGRDPLAVLIPAAKPSAEMRQPSKVIARRLRGVDKPAGDPKEAAGRVQRGLRIISVMRNGPACHTLPNQPLPAGGPPTAVSSRFTPQEGVGRAD
jgi:hypothetical protein